MSDTKNFDRAEQICDDRLKINQQTEQKPNSNRTVYKMENEDAK